MHSVTTQPRLRKIGRVHWSWMALRAFRPPRQRQGQLNVAKEVEERMVMLSSAHKERKRRVDIAGGDRTFLEGEGRESLGVEVVGRNDAEAAWR